MISLRLSAVVASLLAVLYQIWLKDTLFITLGIGRALEPIEKFPFRCRRLQHKQLEACGDMWLDEKSRVLYAACAGAQARNEWNPSLSRYNASGRRPEGSELMAIYIDEPRKDGLFKMHKVQPTHYGSTPGDGHLDLTGFDVEIVDSSTIRFWLLNQRPLYDATGLMDHSKKGVNTTIDVYEYRNGEKSMRHIATSWSPKLHSPNKIAWVGANNFVVSNDRSAQAGFRRKLDPLLGGGSLVYYDDWYDRYTMTPKYFATPGQLVRGPDDRIYVPSLVDDKIRLFELQADETFKNVHSIKMGMPITSLTLDSSGDFWVVGRSKYDPTGRSSTTTVFKVEKFEERKFRFVPRKMLEDRDAKILSGVTIARHDARTKRIFLGGAFTPFITMCERTS